LKLGSDVAPVQGTGKEIVRLYIRAVILLGPFHKMVGNVGIGAHVPGSNIEQMPVELRPVGHPPPGNGRSFYEHDLIAIACLLQDLNSQHGAGKSAANNGDGGLEGLFRLIL